MTRKKTRTKEDGKTRTGERRRGKQEYKVVDAPDLRTTTMGRACDVKSACFLSIEKSSCTLFALTDYAKLQEFLLSGKHESKVI